MKRLLKRLVPVNRDVRCGSITIRFTITRTGQRLSQQVAVHPGVGWKVHLGPGRNWDKPDDKWLTVDVDSDRADIVIDFNQFSRFPLADASVSCIYGSHVFEHISIFNAPRVFAECYRVLEPGGVFRLVLPDVRKSIERYMAQDYNFHLFQRRMQRADKKYGKRYTLFEALREDFLSPSSQSRVLGTEALAHQNAWDFETLVVDLERVGFDPNRAKKMDYKTTDFKDFLFIEGTYPSEADERYRSLYVEVTKT